MTDTNVIQDGIYNQYWTTTTSTSLWTRPNISSNNDPRFKLTPSGEWTPSSGEGSLCWRAFDGNYSTRLEAYRRGGGWGNAYLQMDTPEPLRITGYTFSGLYNGNNYNIVYQFIVWRYTNNDWVQLYDSGMRNWGDSATITFNNDVASTSYKMRLACPGYSSGDQLTISEIVPIVTTTVKNKVDSPATGATTTTHDIYKSFKDENNYYGLSY